MFWVLIYVGLQSDANHHPEISWLPWCGEDDCLLKTVDTSFAASEQSKQNLNTHNAFVVISTRNKQISIQGSAEETLPQINLAEKILKFDYIALGSHFGGHPEFLKVIKDLSLLYSRYVLQAL